MEVKKMIAINKVLKTIIDSKEIEINSVLKFKFLGIMNQFSPHINNYETIRQEKIREYGVKDEDGNIIIPDDDKEIVQKVVSELNEVINCDVDIEIKKIKADDILSLNIPSDYLIVLYELMEA